MIHVFSILMDKVHGIHKQTDGQYRERDRNSRDESERNAGDQNPRNRNEERL